MDKIKTFRFTLSQSSENLQDTLLIELLGQFIEQHDLRFYCSIFS